MQIIRSSKACKCIGENYSCLRQRQQIHRLCDSCWQHLVHTRWLHWTHTRAAFNSQTNFLRHRAHFSDASSWLPRITPRMRNSRISRLIWLHVDHTKTPAACLSIIFLIIFHHLTAPLCVCKKTQSSNKSWPVVITFGQYCAVVFRSWSWSRVKP